MIRGFLMTVIAGACWHAALVAGAEQTKTESGWGKVTGRVVFEGDLADPKVKQHRDDLPIYQRILRRDSVNGVRPRILGRVSNQSLLIDDETRGVRDAFVYLRRKPERIHPALENQELKPLAVVYEKELFWPRSLVVGVGQTVRMLSRDGGANFKVDPLRSPGVNPLVTPEKPAEWQPTAGESLPIRVTNNVHPAAVGFWLVVDHPYAVLTETDGSFLLDNLPAGELELRVWHETTGWVARLLKVTVKTGETVTLPPQAITVDKIK